MVLLEYHLQVCVSGMFLSLFDEDDQADNAIAMFDQFAYLQLQYKP
jgi:hypothetical protein